MSESSLEGRKLAADLANAEAGYCYVDASQFSDDRGVICRAFARLATEHLALEAEHEKVLADLREICGIVNALPPQQASLEVALWLGELRELAAKWRVEDDPLVEAVPGLLVEAGFNHSVKGAEYHLALAALKRGYEIGAKP